MAGDNRWDRLKQIFLEALEQPPAKRVEWLARAYGDEEVYSEVRALLDAHDSDPFFLEQGPQVDPADRATAVNLDAPLAPGMIVGDGRYRIIGEAGRGGLAVVFVAEDLLMPRRVDL